MNFSSEKEAIKGMDAFSTFHLVLAPFYKVRLKGEEKKDGSSGFD